MKHTIGIILFIMFGAAGILHAYPTEVYIKNDTNSKLVFWCYWVDTRTDLSPFARRTSHTIEPQETGHFGALFLDGHPVEFIWEKITAHQYKTFPRGMVGGQYPLLNTFSFDAAYSGPLYLIYSDAGFSVVHPEAWQDYIKK